MPTPVSASPPVSASASVAAPFDFDALFVGGCVLDGEGRPAVRADVGLRADRIAAVGDLTGASAVVRVECRGGTLAPGFIDAHSHSDAYLLIEPTAPSKLHQGIVTEVIGQCGASAAPLVGEACLPQDWAAQVDPAAWRSLGEYRALLQSRGLGPNVVALVGHRMLRMAVMGRAARAAGPEEIRAMAALLEAALADGAAGLSSGLAYEPARHATSRELTALASVAAQRGGLYATHLRCEGAALPEAVAEAVGVAQASGVALQVSHLKAVGAAHWDRIEPALERVAEARAAGLAVHADVYPYLASGTELDVLLPDWAGQGRPDEVLRRIEEPSSRAAIRAALDLRLAGDAADRVVVGGTWCAATHPFRGQSLTAVAAALGGTPAEALLWLIVRDRLRTGAFFFEQCDATLRRVLEQPWVMAGSDASLRAPTGRLGGDHPHPRAYGSHARLLAWARRGGPLSLAETVRRMTSLPADALGLPDRGRLRTGAFADLVLFDPETVRDRATYAAPHRFADGVREVWINGVPAVRAGRPTGALAGRWLERRAL